MSGNPSSQDKFVHVAITALTRALTDVTNEFSAFAYQHEEEVPSREEIYEQLGLRLQSLAVITHKRGKNFRRVLVDLAAYAIYAASHSEEI
ncbi:MAG: hypothetical protein DMG30_11980 [Acidobacteria bacterium]|nr:MAG: hypothetical protein DMG30_11980 [Acidobacteriota bacterium]